MTTYTYLGLFGTTLDDANAYDPEGLPGLSDTVNLSNLNATGDLSVDTIENGSVIGSIKAKTAINVDMNGGTLQATTVDDCSATASGATITATTATGTLSADLGGSVVVAEDYTDNTATEFGIGANSGGSLRVDGNFTVDVPTAPPGEGPRVGVSGGTVSVGGDMTLTRRASVPVSLQVTNDGSMTVSQNLVLKNVNGEIEFGSTVTVDGFCQIDSSTVNVVASQPNLTVQSSFTVGVAGSATLDITSGAVQSQGGYIGGQSTGKGVVDVSGTNSTWTITGVGIIVGDAGTGTLTIQSGGGVNASAGGAIDIGALRTGVGTLVLDGATSSFDVKDDPMRVGDAGKGTFDVQDGQQFTGAQIDIAEQHGSTGTVNVDNAQLTASTFNMGLSGSGDLDATDGGTVQSQSGYIGGQSTGKGVVDVSGTDSTWTITGVGIIVGDAGTGTLTIQSGGGVDTSAGGAIDIGDLRTGVGTLVLDRATSSFDVNDDPMRVGDAGNGTFDVQDGQQFTGAQIDIAEQPGSTGTVNVDNAQLTASMVNVGGGASAGGTGSVVLTDGGKFLVTGDLTVWRKGSIAISSQSSTDSGAIIDGSAANNGNISANKSGDLQIDGAVTGTGSIDIGNLGEAVLNGSVAAGQRILFDGSKAELTLAAPSTFNATISGFTATDIIDLSSIPFNTGTKVNLVGSTLIVTPTTGPAIQLKFNPADLPTSSFALQKDAVNGGTDIVLDSPASIASGATTTLASTANNSRSLTNYVGASHVALLGNYIASLFATVEGQVGTPTVETQQGHAVLARPHAA